MTNIDEIIDRLNGQIIIDDYKSPIIASIRTAETKHILTEFKQAVIAEHEAKNQIAWAKDFYKNETDQKETS